MTDFGKTGPPIATHEFRRVFLWFAMRLRRKSKLKYAIFTVADQTIVYRTPEGSWTTKHKEAQLFDSNEEAGLFAEKEDYIEQIPSTREFRSRKDTW